MTKLFLDTEFDGYKGELISIALVSDRYEFYEVVKETANDEWVKENIIPRLGKKAISYQMAQEKLRWYLSLFEDPLIICDWPDDIRHLCDMLIVSPGARFGGDLTFLLWDSPAYEEHPGRHNALVDARLLRSAYLLTQ